MKTYYVYIATNKPRGVLYIGVTNDLIKRIWQHKQKIVKGFTEKYNLNKLAYFEETESVEAAIRREKRMKKWNRRWKINLIEKVNPEWRDLYYELIDSPDKPGNDKLER